MERKNIVGVQVRKARKNAKPPITQLELIARLQVLGLILEQPALSKIEMGYRPVTDREVVALSNALKVSTAWLLGIDK